MKKSLLILLVLTLSFAVKAEETSFRLMYGDTPIEEYFNLSLYKNGRYISKNYSRTPGLYVFSDLDDTYTYKTSLGHVGAVSPGENTDLECGKVIFNVHDSEGNPQQEMHFNIYEDGDIIISLSTGYNGSAGSYLKPGIRYAYANQQSDGEYALYGRFIINAGETAEIDCIIPSQSGNRVTFISKYQDLPVSQSYGSSSLFKYPDKNTSLGSLSQNTTIDRLEAGQYWIKNQYDVFSEPFTIEEDNQVIYREHKKITFICDDSDPSILESLKVAGSAQSNYPSSNKITDGKGHVVYYLIPGKYKYSYFGGTGYFTVEEEDMTLNIKSQPVKISIVSADDNPMPQFPFSISDNSGYDSRYEEKKYTTDSNGQCVVRSSDITKTYIKINGFKNKLPVTDIETNEITLKVLKCSFNYPDPSGSNCYALLSNGEARLTLYPGEAIYLLSGTYTCTVYDSQLISNDEPLKIDSDLEICRNLPGRYNFSVTLDGEPYTGYLYVKNNNTNLSNQCIAGKVSVFIKDPKDVAVAIGYAVLYSKTDVYDGQELNFYTVKVDSEGPGLAFPVTNGYEYSLLSGNNLNLVAVAAAREEFDHWTINGKEYFNSAIDYLVEGPTEATAVFSSASNYSTMPANGLDIKVTDDTVYFGCTIDSLVNIYNAAGILMKSSYVVSDHLSIRDLGQGVYVLTTQVEGSSRSAKFQKK